jgi:hypothetical protein
MLGSVRLSRKVMAYRQFSHWELRLHSLTWSRPSEILLFLVTCPERDMQDSSGDDNLTKLEKKTYFYISCVALGLDFYLTILIKNSTIKPNIFINAGMFVLLLTGVVFGWGYNKRVRVLDLRRFGASND